MNLRRFKSNVFSWLYCGILCCWLSAHYAVGQTNDFANGWKLDVVLLKSGQTLEGIILSDDAGIEFAEVRRPAGKPMNVVVRPLERREILRIDPVAEADRAATRRELNSFVRRAAIEARQIDQVALSRATNAASESWRFSGDWFSLESSASEATSRQAVVRMEQMFAAYRQILPPLRTPRERLKIKLFGSTAEYAQFLRGFGLDIANPAFFAADFNLVAAGSDVDLFRRQLTSAASQHATQRAQLDAEMALLPERIAELVEQLKSAGVSEAERRTVATAEQRTWQERRQQLQAAIAQSERRNAAKMEQVTQEMYARLYHEAFHAYLENYVYPHQEFDVPRWLNEGLALTFEAAQLDGNTLRVDAPNRRLLVPLQETLRSQPDLRLAEVLTARSEEFLPAHLSAQGQAARLYQASWGLAFYLVFEQPVLGTEAFKDYVSPTASKALPIERFERLVGQKLTEFEPQWREAILRLKP